MNSVTRWTLPLKGAKLFTTSHYSNHKYYLPKVSTTSKSRRMYGCWTHSNVATSLDSMRRFLVSSRDRSTIFIATLSVCMFMRNVNYVIEGLFLLLPLVRRWTAFFTLEKLPRPISPQNLYNPTRFSNATSCENFGSWTACKSFS